MTTHFMDEADILADRKAIISKVKLLLSSLKKAAAVFD